jgi:hypothetical protein
MNKKKKKKRKKLRLGKKKLVFEIGMYYHAW